MESLDPPFPVEKITGRYDIRYGESSLHEHET